MRAMVLTAGLAALLCAAPVVAEQASEGDPGPTAAVTINAGAEHGIAVGNAFRVERRDRGEEPVHLGALTVEAVEARLATGRFERVERAPAPRAGDLALPPQ